MAEQRWNDHRWLRGWFYRLVFGGFALLSTYLALTDTPWFWLGSAMFAAFLICTEYERRMLSPRIRELCAATATD